ncbi:MAG: type 1 glutamine amidotransferase family protein, partial [Planctomycetota bacterium]
LFRRWLKARGLTERKLGVDPGRAELNGNDRLTWYSRIFGAEQRFADYRNMTAVAREAFGPQVLTGANYSPHHGMVYYGENLQWIDAFKHNAMSMFWTEDYIFSVPEVPQIISFLFARIHCAVKYNRQPIHMYVMPHSPAQTAANYRRNLVFSIGSGARHIDNFWVAPQEAYSENYVSWRYTDMFREIHCGMYDTAAVEPWLKDARRRKARVALVTGKATDINESHTRADEKNDPFLKVCRLTGAGRGGVKQNICHRDQQALYLALRHAQVLVDLITDDDIAEDGILRDYDVVYHAGEWADDRVVPELARWVKDGGVLYACTGLGRFNQFGEEDPGMLDLLGLTKAPIEKSLWHVRPLLELPLAKPIDRLRLDGAAIGAVAFRQKLAARTAEVLGRWPDGSAAVTVRELGKGKAYAVGTAPGLSYLRTGLRRTPWARGGEAHVYNPVGFDAAAARLVRLGIDSAEFDRQVVCSNPNVEALALDNAHGTLVTLVNWTNDPEVELTVRLRLPGKADGRTVRSIQAGKRPAGAAEGDTLSFTTTVAAADFVTVR